MTLILPDFTCWILDETPSTMDSAREISLAQHALGHDPQTIVCCLARKQTQGRGRGGSTWVQGVAHAAQSPDTPPPPRGALNLQTLTQRAGLGVAWSLEQDTLPLTLKIPAGRVAIPWSWASIAVGCALWDALQKTVAFLHNTWPELPWENPKNIKVALKWPNDLVRFLGTVQEPRLEKLAGILCEASVQGGNPETLYVGVGINFFSAPAGVDNAQTIWNVILPTDGLKAREKRTLQQWEKQGYKSLLLERFGKNFQEELLEYLTIPRTVGQLQALAMERSLPVGTWMSANKGQHQGPFLDIDTDGALRLDGVAQPIRSGDVEATAKPKDEPGVRRPQAPLLPADGAFQVQRIAPEAKPTPQTPSPETSVGCLGLDLGNTRAHLSALGAWRAEGFPLHLELRALSTTGLHEDLGPSRRKMFQPVLDWIRHKGFRELHIFSWAVCKPAEADACVKGLTGVLHAFFPELKIHHRGLSSVDFLALGGLQGQYDVSTLGADRALRFALAAQRAQDLSESVLVASVGTALTCEGVTPEGRMAVSLIAPGLDLGLRALHQFTARLPYVHVTSEHTPLLAPRQSAWNTEDSLALGAIHSALGLITSAAATLGTRHVLITGGGAEAVLSWAPFHTLGKELSFTWIPAPETQVLHGEIIKAWVEGKKGTSAPVPKNTPVRPDAPQTPEPQAAVRDEEGTEDEVSLDSDALTLQAAMALNEQLPLTTRVPWSVLRTMLKARLRERNSGQGGEVEQALFRRLGGRMEHAGVGERLDKHLAERFRFHNREVWRSRILAGEVRVQHGAGRQAENDPEKANLQAVKHYYRIKTYDQIWLFQPPTVEPDVLENIEIVADDGDTVVFNKPGNLVIHAAGLYSRNTFLAVAERMGYGNCHPVHRIDRETSGILVTARTSATRHRIAVAFRESGIRKMYLAVTRGTAHVPEAFKVCFPIGDAPESRIRLKLWVGGPNAVDAETDVFRLARHNDYSLFACIPRTGRTNQIRIHLASLGQWIVGDKMYHPSEEVFLKFHDDGLTEEVLQQVLFPRHLLHNTAIQGPEVEASIISRPVICPLTEDMMQFQPLLKLLDNAGIPHEHESQKKAIEGLFERVHDVDFSKVICFSDISDVVSGASSQ